MVNRKKTKTHSGSVSLNIGGIPLEFEFEAPVKPVSARRMLPVFQQVTNRFVSFSVEQAESQGKEISCKAGCGACCRQPVPIGKHEAFAIAELVSSLEPEMRTRIEERFAEALTRLDESEWLERLEKSESHEERRELTMEYFRLGIPCPFLIDESCSIHKDRPLSCREYLVTSPAENCSAPSEDSIEMVDLPTTPSRIFREISDSEASSAKNYLPLVGALRYARENQETGMKQKGGHWVKKLFEAIVSEAQKRHS